MLAWVGASAVREQYELSEGVTSADLVLTWQYALFIYGRHETSFTATAGVLPSLTIYNRVRINLSVDFKREFFKDFYWGIGAYEIYDSNPQGEGARNNDFGVNSSLGWSF